MNMAEFKASGSYEEILEAVRRSPKVGEREVKLVLRVKYPNNRHTDFYSLGVIRSGDGKAAKESLISLWNTRGISGAEYDRYEKLIEDFEMAL